MLNWKVLSCVYVVVTLLLIWSEGREWFIAWYSDSDVETLGSTSGLSIARLAVLSISIILVVIPFFRSSPD